MSAGATGDHVRTAIRAEWRRGGTSPLKDAPIYKGHRIHTAALPSGRWLSTIVNLGKEKRMTKDSLTAAATRIWGAYDSEAEAIEAAKAYIDAEDGDRQD
jgi:hypothetical protein